MVMPTVPATLVAMLGAAVAMLGAACDPGFEEETEVIDLRPLAMTVSPPEQVLDIDPEMLPNPADLLAQLRPVDICALSGDPIDRAVTWSFTVCVEGDDVRCDPGRPQIALVTSRITPDPETALPRPQMCHRLEPDLALLAVLQSAIDADPLSGFSGIDLLVQWKLSAEGNQEVFAGKRIRFAARIPENRVANQNPSLLGFSTLVSTAEGMAEMPLPLGRCVDQTAPITIRAGDEVQIFPIEPPALREAYVVPTFDGKVRMFTETIQYQWYTSSGSFNRGTSGGGRDAFGNIPELDSTFRTKDPRDLREPVDAAIWIVQRDERLGEAWFESCVRVMP
jgi:hypothetical protein